MTYFIYTFTGALCNYFFCVHLLPNKLAILKRLIIFLYAFSTIFLLNQIYGQASTFITFSGLMLLIYLFAENRFLNLSCYLFGYFYTITFNYIFMWATGFILKMDMETLVKNHILLIIFSCVYCIFCGITTKMIGNHLHRKLNITKYFSDPHLLKAIFIDLFLLVMLYIFNFSYGERLGYNYGVIALNGIIFLLLFIITVFLMYSVYKAAIKEQTDKHRMAQFENLRVYTERVESSYVAMRKFKHDYINILSTMSEFMNENDMEGLKEYYEKSILPISHSFTVSDTKMGLLSYIKDTALKSLLSSKFVYMIETGIKLEIELQETIGQLPIDCLDLCRVIGIFLDNAMEAAKETEKKEVRFCMFYRGDDLYLVIQNTALPLPYAIANLRSHEFSTKGEDRGIGLFNVDMVLKNYRNVLWNTNYEEPYFTQELILKQTIAQE